MHGSGTPQDKDINDFTQISSADLRSILREDLNSAEPDRLSAVSYTHLDVYKRQHLEHEPNRFQLMEKTHPQQYHYCIHELELGAVLDYIGVPYSCR